MNVESRQEPKFKVGDKITNGKGIFTIVTLSSDKYIVEDSFGRYGFLHFKNQDEWEIVEEKDLDLKFKAGDRVFNKVSRKWVNIIEFDIETGLYIVRYDDGIQGRSLESELRFMEEKSKSHNDMCKKLIEEMNPNVEVNVKTKPEPKFKRGDFVFSGIDFCAMKVIDRCYDEHWRYRIFDDVNEYWLFEKELKKVEIGDVVYSKVWKEKVIVRDFCDDKFILVADFNGKLLKSLPSLIKQIKEETKPKPSNTVSVDKAAEVFAEMLVELCPELLGFGGAAKEWENEFRKRLEE